MRFQRRASFGFGLVVALACTPAPDHEVPGDPVPAPPAPIAEVVAKVETKVIGDCRWTKGWLNCDGGIEIREVVDVQLGEKFGCALRSDGTVWCWGVDDEGQLGRGYLSGISHRPAPVWGLTDVRAIRIDERSACAQTSAGERCWGWIGEEMRMVASDPSQPAIQRFGAGTCTSEHPRDLPDRLQATHGEGLLDLLAPLGLDPRDPWLMPERESWIFPSLLERADVREVDLDADSTPEWILEVVLVAEEIPDRHRRFMAQVFHQDVEGRWCPLLAASELSQSNNMQYQPADVHPHEPRMIDPIVLDLVELTAAGRPLIRARRRTGYVHHYPFRSHFTTSFWSFTGSALVCVFGPFTTFEEEHGDDWQNTTTGTLEIRGQGWPKSLVTSTRTCRDPGEDSDEWRCEPRRTKRWVFRDGEYR